MVSEGSLHARSKPVGLLVKGTTTALWTDSRSGTCHSTREEKKAKKKRKDRQARVHRECLVSVNRDQLNLPPNRANGTKSQANWVEASKKASAASARTSQQSRPRRYGQSRRQANAGRRRVQRAPHPDTPSYIASLGP